MRYNDEFDLLAFFGVPARTRADLRQHIASFPDMKEDAANMRERGIGFYIYGPVGSGKTLLAAHLFRQYLIHVRKFFRGANIEHVLMKANQTPSDPDYTPSYCPAIASKLIFVSMQDLIGKARKELEQPSGNPRSDWMDACRDAELLVIDDFAAVNPTPWVHEQIDHLIGSRVADMLPTIITSNFSTDELYRIYYSSKDARVPSRLSGVSEQIHLRSRV
jgi:DNA replication protein DnaC